MARNKRNAARSRSGARRGGRARLPAGRRVAAELGRRIEAAATHPLADLIRRQYWESRGPAAWRQVCRRSLQERLAASWAPVVDRIGRG